MRILVVEDEKDMNNIIVRRLSSAGYSVDACFNGMDAIDYLACAEYDAVILDIMMPQKDGLNVVRELRSRNNDTPVLFLTALDSIADRVKGLDSGADDYLIKPFAFDELFARLRVMTRKKAGNKLNVFCVADLSVDCKAHTVKRGDQELFLTSKEFALLEYLIRNKGAVLSREQIENNLWNYDYAGGSNVVDVYIRFLRKKIDDGFVCKLIHTVRGTGYVLREE